MFTQNLLKGTALPGGTETCAMQPTGYTITPRDAEIIRDLIAFLGEDVFDQRRRDGAIAKSETFLRKITDARSVVEQLRSNVPR